MAPSAPPAGAARAFRAAFGRWSRRVRGGLALEHVVTWAAVGLLAGAVASGAAWKTRHGALRPAGAAGGLLGLGAGLAVARRRRWRDADVALYLDGKLGAHEVIATAVEMASSSLSPLAPLAPLATEAGDAGSGAPDDARAVVLSRATEALASATPRRVRPPWLRPGHAALPVAAAAIAAFCRLPLPPPPPAPALPPGAETVQLAQVAGLEKVVQLGELDARDDAQRERLKRLAGEARALRDKLRTGVEKREAQADIARLGDQLSAERLSLGDGQERQGMESAMGKLAENPALKSAAKALGDRDLVSLDDAMRTLADTLERGDRERAKQTLQEAADAARRANAPGVAKALEAQRKRLEELGKKADNLRELGKALGDGLGKDGKDALDGLGKSGLTRDEQRLAEALDQALGKLTPEERKRLAETMKRKSGSAGGDEGGGASKEDQRRLADQLSTPEGLEQLEEQLRKMAAEPPPGSEEAEREKALEDARKGAGETGGEVGIPIPIPGGSGEGPGKGGPGKGSQGQSGAGRGSKGDSGPGGPGHTEGGEGPGKHEGQTGVVEGGRVDARTTGKMNKGQPMPGLVMGRTAGRAGETANVQGTGALGAAAAGEVGGVDRSEVPEEYRQQVGRYFQPK